MANALLSAGVQVLTTAVAGSLIKKSAEKDQKKINAYLEGLSLKQKQELEELLKSKTSEIEREKAFFQMMAVHSNQKLLNDTNRKRNISFAAVGVLLTSLIVVIYLKRRK